MKYMRVWLWVIMVCSYGSSLMAFGERPTFKEPPKPVAVVTPIPGNSGGSSVRTVPVLVPSANVKPSENAEITEDVLQDLQKNYQDLLKQKQFPEAVEMLQKIPESKLTRRNKIEKAYLTTFKAVEEEVAKTNILFQKEDELDETTKRSVQKLYKEAQVAMLNGKNDLARDLLIHVLFLHRRNVRAKKLLEFGLELPPGSYKVEDIQAKYWNKSNTSFYGGNYASSVDDLNVLVFFDKENPLVYEKMGSSYYMMGEKRKAVESWNTALFFNPANKDLEKIVEKTKQLIAEDDKEASALRDQNKKKISEDKGAQVETQVFGIYKTQNEAYAFAGELKKKGLEPLVEEMDNGKWAVKVPKSQLEKKK